MIPTEFLERFVVFFTENGVELNGFEMSIRDMPISIYLDIASGSEYLMQSPWLLKIMLTCCAKERMIVH